MPRSQPIHPAIELDPEAVVRAAKALPSDARPNGNEDLVRIVAGAYLEALDSNRLGPADLVRSPAERRLIELIKRATVGPPTLDPPGDGMSLAERDLVVETALGFWFSLVVELRSLASQALYELEGAANGR